MEGLALCPSTSSTSFQREKRSETVLVCDFSTDTDGEGKQYSFKASLFCLGKNTVDPTV